ncbi:MAG: DUF2127 domain-containing protein [Ideonella sp.]
MKQRSTIRLIAFFEAFKGAFVLLAGLGVLTLLHKDLHDLAVSLVEHSHLNPASHYPQIFIDAASNAQNSKLVWLAAGAVCYSSVRLVEAYGLFYERAWAELLAAASGAIYVPLELFRLMRHPTWLSAVLLLVNIAVVAIMVHALLLRRRARDVMAASQPASLDHR